ncbi:hypothetical protein MSG28_002938 [Choristoneura fumiferana]|uniref:Uncharacterized protein n=1 Tax=Choristoneura fumiferana TaxID=7141 RepID=A0ACC0JK69_CHOFU|nr:hypothetical protein MSG28_002938 [Choristoneura fumiferana]
MRAACVARACAESLSDGNLVVTEKSGDEANSRFEHDFKTIADVLAQEAAKVEISRHCRELRNNVWGEECGEINGHTIRLETQVDKTALLLSQVVPKEQALKLAKGSHCDLNPKLVGDLAYDLPPINDASLAVWIDPIDATAEFIAGVKNKDNPDGSGLSCVTVLIGAFVKATGEPVMGVVNQPFYNNNYRRVGGCEIPKTQNDNTILVSGAEDPELVESYKSNGWEVKPARGCGHKLLKVALASIMSVQVDIVQGTLEGKLCSYKGKAYYSFEGIPYAKPPIGKLRFREPQEPVSWIGIRDATKPGNKCIQINPATMKDIIGSEDCLFLNVYTPHLPNEQNKKIPVMFYIHGGKLLFGYGDYYRPDYFIEQDVILVTMNYRLHALGFLCLNEAEAAGNMGLKDTVMAFNWVKNNIDKFNGDNNNITVFGESAGGAVVTSYLTTKMVNGFSKFDDEESEQQLGATASGRKRLFSKELRCMMYGFGDDQNPYTESVDFLEDLVIEFLTETTHRAMEVGRTGRVQVEDIIFLVRKDQRKYARVKDLLTMNEELKKARKAFDEVKYVGT